MITIDKDLLTDIAALIILGSGIYMAATMTAMPEYLSMAFGSSVTYLFVKHSPNTL